MTREFLKDAESVHSGLSHVPSQPALLTPFGDPGGLLSLNNQPPDTWNTHGIWRNVFANPTASSSARQTTRTWRTDGCGGQEEDGDLRSILRGSCENEGDWQNRPLHNHSWSTCFIPAERGRQNDRY